MYLREAAALIRARTTMEQIAGVYLPQEHVKKGFICCPFHGERTGSLKLYEDSFYCFGCHAHGDAVDFVGRLLGLTAKEAVQRINEDFSLGLPVGEGQQLDMRRRLEIMRAQKARQVEKEQRERKAAAYCDAVDEWTKWAVQMRDNAPTDPNAPYPAAWVEAAEKIDYARYVLDNLEFN